MHRLDFIKYKNSKYIHLTRRDTILKKYPQIRNLFGNDPYVSIPIILATSLHLIISTSATKSYPLSIFLGWLIGGFFSNFAALAMHECSHGLVFRGDLPSAIIGTIASIPLVVPAYAPFKYYHKFHHAYNSVYYSGDHKFDPDLPTYLEARLLSGNIFKRLLFLFLQPLIYAIRPFILHPRKVKKIDVFSLVISIGIQIFIYKIGSFSANLYMLSAAFLGQGLHISAIHFISEHYVLTKIEKNDLSPHTFSYYGWHNYLSLNGGYHVEHHDFPRIPARNLPILKDIASEFYDLPHITSYGSVFVKFLDGKVIYGDRSYEGLWRRVVNE